MQKFKVLQLPSGHGGCPAAHGERTPPFDASTPVVLRRAWDPVGGSCHLPARVPRSRQAPRFLGPSLSPPSRVLLLPGFPVVIRIVQLLPIRFALNSSAGSDQFPTAIRPSTILQTRDHHQAFHRLLLPGVAHQASSHETQSLPTPEE